MANVPRPTQRWFHLSPDRLILGLVAIEGFLFLSERFHWFALNQHKGWTVLVAVASVGVAMLLMLVWLAASLIFRWRFQFSIRSLLVLVVVVAIPCSWFSWEMKQASKQKKVVRELWTLGGYAARDYVLQQSGNTPRAGPPGPAWLRNQLGEDFFASILEVDFISKPVTPAGLERVKGLTRIQWLQLDNGHVTDAGLEYLKGLTQLQGLFLDHTQVTDAGLEQLKGLSKLKALGLFGTRVTGPGLEQLNGLTQFHWLNLGGTPLNDAGLEHLKGLTELRWLCVLGTRVTDEGVKDLQQTLPRCRIFLRDSPSSARPCLKAVTDFQDQPLIWSE